MKIQDLQIRGTIYCLEVNKRSYQPTLTKGTVNYIGKKRAATINNTTLMVVDVDILDSGVLIKAVLPAEQEYGYFENVAYTTNLELLVQEIQNRIEQMEISINNNEKYKQAKSDYEGILEGLKGKIPPKQEDVQTMINNTIATQMDLFRKGIASELAAFTKQMQPAQTTADDKKQKTQNAQNNQ